MKHLLWAICLLTSTLSSAQFNSKTEREIGYFIYHEDYSEAIKLLNASKEEGIRNPKWNYYKGKILFIQENFDSAAIFLLKAQKLGHESNDINYFLGFISHKQNSFEEAEKYYSKYSDSIDENDRSNPVGKEEIEKRIEECRNGIKYLSESKPVKISNLGKTINSEYPDYAPVISADEQTLFFTSRRPNSIGGLIDARDGWNMEDIYFCEKDSLNNWTAPIQMPGYINSKGHDANIGLSPDGQSLFIYRDDALEAGLAGNIYESIWRFHRWTTPEALPSPVNSQYWETGVSTTPDEKTLYFSSNRPGGYGGLDIYSVRMLPDGSWAKPQNLGPNINTKYNEESPFIHPDGKTLYFSSQGHSSMGGFDIFFSSLEDTSWTEPENLGYPLNTAENELYFVLSADGRRGYFSGMRSETFGDKDLYVADLPEKPIQIILLKGRVVDKETEKPLATLIKVYDNDSKELVYVLNSNGVNGRFSSVLPPHRNYNIQVDVDQSGYAHYSLNIHIPDQKEFVEVDTVIRLQRADTIHIITLLPNIFFDLNVAELDSSSDLELDALAKRLFRNPDLNLEVAVHTYSQPSKEENMDLSQRRANSIKQALVDRGVAGDRIFPVGYGQLFPQENEKDAWQNEGRKPKDRVEAIIIPSFDVDMDPAEDGFYYKNHYKPFELKPEPEEAEMIDYIDDAGMAASSEEKENIEIDEDQATVASVGEREKETKTPNQASALPDLSGLRVFFIVNKIYFRLDPDSVLGQVLDAMEEHPDMNIIIHSYTDTVGHPDYNVFLSKIRADNVKKEMVERGADPTRIRTIGHGEANPIYSNKTRQGRMKNRRSEFEAVRKQD